MRISNLVLLLSTLPIGSCSVPYNRVVVYCAQDAEFAEGIFADFTRMLGIKVEAKFDTEASKTVGLVEDIVNEAKRPRCDIFWGNEPLQAIRLHKKGLLEAYSSPSASEYPSWTQGATWQAFAARPRIIIVNTELVPEAERPRSLFELEQPKWKGKLCMAKPLFGTTATQAACLWEVLGPQRTKIFYENLHKNEIAIVAGNRHVASEVAKGKYALGLTDSDDALAELQQGKPVALIFPDQNGYPDYPRWGTLYLPNTVSLVKGAPNINNAKSLIDYLLRPETEVKLAEGGGYQIPLNPKTKATLHPALIRPEKVKVMNVNWEKAADCWEPSQEFLRNLFAR